MVPIALSFEGEVEKYGAYVGIAAFFGLAVLSLLYFAQARELKRLREWAGRAPERARELEQRVVAQAAASSRRPPPVPGTTAAGAIAPPRRLAEMPAPPVAAQPAQGGQATELADAVEEEPATNGNVPAVPPPPAPGTPAAANGTTPPVAAPDADAGQPGHEPGAEQQDADAPEPDADTPEPDADAPEQDADAPEQDAERAEERAAAPATAAAGAAEAPATAEPDADADPDADGDEAEAARPGEVPAAAVPRATPAQRVGVSPRPTPLPLRQSRPSATPAARSGAGRRPPAGPQRRPGAKPEREGRSAGTIALLVGVAVLILGGGAFAISQLGGDDTSPPPNRTTPAPNTNTGGNGSSSTSPADTNVAVLNGTTFTGLAGQLADRVSQEGGFKRGYTGNNERDQTLQSSTVYYADGFRSQARAVARLLSISAIQPIDVDTQAAASDADVVVLAGADQAP